MYDEAYERVIALIALAQNVRAPFVRMRAKPMEGASAQEEDAAVTALIARVLPQAEKAGVTLLLETKGCYADTARLTRLLDGFRVGFPGGALGCSLPLPRGGGDAGADG